MGVKVKNFFKNQSNLVIILSFLLPAALLHLVFWHYGFYPFGDKTLLIMDMKGQYVEFYSSLRYIGSGDNSIFFNWSRSMGGNFMGLVAFYIGSPLTLLTLFFPIEEMPTAIYVLSVLKMSLCGLTFSIFMEHGFHERKGKWYVVPFAACYALMSYNIANGMCLMWVDGVLFLPLVLLGVEKILKGKKGIVYMISIALLFISNYYTSYMVGIFTALYFLVRVIAEYKKEKRKELLVAFGKFALNTVLAICIALPILLPTAMDLVTGKLTYNNYCPTDVVFNFEFFEVFKKLLPGQYDSLTNTNALPSIYCGVLTLVFVICFFLHGKNNFREKIGFGLLGIFLLISFWNFDLDKVWHGFQYPNWFPHRYAFLFSALLLTVGCRGYQLLEGKLKHYIVQTCIWTFVCAELMINATAVTQGLDNQFHYGTMEEYTAFLDKTYPAVKAVKAKDDGLYRMDKDYEYSKNDSMLLNYNSLTHYSSTFNTRINHLVGRLGFAQTHVWSSGYGSTLLTDTLFGVKYRIQEKALPSSYEVLETYDEVTLYENTLALPIAFTADRGCYGKKVEWGYYFSNQDQLVKDLLGEEIDFFARIGAEKVEADGGFYLDFTALSSNPHYIRMSGSGSGEVYVGDRFVGKYYHTEAEDNLYIGEFEAGEKVRVYVKTNVESTDEYVFQLDVKKLEYAVSKLNKNPLNVTYHKNGTIKGTVTAKANQVLFTSIPYDEGFTVKVDGVKTEYGIYADTFMVIPLTEGEHEIKISYVSPGFVPGMWIAAIAFVISVFYYRKKSKGEVAVQDEVTEGGMIEAVTEVNRVTGEHSEEADTVNDEVTEEPDKVEKESIEEYPQEPEEWSEEKIAEWFEEIQDELFEEEPEENQEGNE